MILMMMKPPQRPEAPARTLLPPWLQRRKRRMEQHPATLAAKMQCRSSVVLRAGALQIQ